MAAVDHLIGQMRRNQEAQTPPDCVARFMCTKHSWRGKYRRIFCITPHALVTQHPDTLAITNSWSFVGEPDIDAVAVGASDAEDKEFSISARQDAKARSAATGRGTCALNKCWCRCCKLTLSGLISRATALRFEAMPLQHVSLH